MFNPIEFKHDITSRPLLWMLDKARANDAAPSDADAVAFAIVGLYTAAANVYPAAALIHMGQLPPMLFTHTTFKRFNPWLEPVFHYSRELSKAERIGAAAASRLGKSVGTKAGAKLGARIGGRLIPGVGWALLAYDVYDIAFNQSLWGFDFA